MVAKYSQFYFTKEDDDYSNKGSRDPLAFQVLWQHQGKKLIPFLSTVSVNLNDFQILCLAYYFYGKEPDNSFVRFFIRFEQLMAYVRFDPLNGGGFNGVDRIRKKLLENPNKVSISNTPGDEILSNQRAYGIWGKYNRPFNDIGFTTLPDFQNIFDEKVDNLKDLVAIRKIINNVLTKPESNFKLVDIQCMKALLEFTNKERVFYSDAILKVNANNTFQNELFQFVSAQSLPKDLELYNFLHLFAKSLNNKNDVLKTILEEIEFTEKILCPLNQIFRYIQTKPIWEKKEILEDPYINQCKNPVDYIFVGGNEHCKIKNQLAKLFYKNNWNLIEDLAIRNKEETEKRDGGPWITITKDIIDVHHADGGFPNPDFDPNRNYSNAYFIDTYFKLYRQATSSI